MNIKFTKKEINEILHEEYYEELNKIFKLAQKYNLYFRSGVKYKDINQFINYLKETEGNYFDLHSEIKLEFSSLLN